MLFKLSSCIDSYRPYTVRAHGFEFFWIVWEELLFNCEGLPENEPENKN